MVVRHAPVHVVHSGGGAQREGQTSCIGRKVGCPDYQDVYWEGISHNDLGMITVVQQAKASFKVSQGIELRYEVRDG